MMRRRTFLAAFDAKRWLTGPEVMERLEQARFWDHWWRQASQAAKLAYIASRCWRYLDEDGIPFIISMDCGEGPARTLMYKPYDALSPEEVKEVHSYYMGLGRYERRAAAICEAIWFRKACSVEDEGDQDC